MRKKLMTIALAGSLVFGGTTVALAGPGNGNGPDPDGNAKKGLCTAYFNGQKKGHDKKASPVPFGNVEEAADDGDDDTPVYQDVYEYCGDVVIGGNPGHNGRYPGCFNGDTDNDPDTHDCVDG